MDWTTLAAAAMSLVGTLSGTFGGILVANRLTAYRIDQLEKRGEIFVLRPQVKPVSRLEKNKETLYAFYEHGYHYMERRFDDLMEYLEK